MKILHIGGTGLISSACVAEDIVRGRDVFVLNRGFTDKAPLPIRGPPFGSGRIRPFGRAGGHRRT